jgi:hypothetical protein
MFLSEPFQPKYGRRQVTGRMTEPTYGHRRYVGSVIRPVTCLLQYLR